MKLDNIINEINRLAEEHRNTEDFELAEAIEIQAEMLIVGYCEEQGYVINGFPTEKKLIKNELDDDYFCRERFQLYLDTLATQKDEVAELMWLYTNTFWPNHFENKIDYLDFLNGNLESGVFYDVDLA